MTLAELIHRALKDPKFRLALETGTLSMTGTNLTPMELKAASQVLQHAKGKQDRGLLSGTYPAWRE